MESEQDLNLRSKKEASRLIHYFDFRCMVVSAVPRDVIDTWLKEYAKKWVYQKEKGDKGTLHYQGRFQLIKRRRTCEILKHMDWIYHCGIFYLQPTTKAALAEDDAWSYVNKADTRIEGPWTEKQETAMYIPKHVLAARDHLHPFQRHIFDIANNPALDSSNRVINLVYCPKGNKGKTTVAQLILGLGLGIIVPTYNDQEKIMQATCSLVQHMNKMPNVVISDMPRGICKDRLGSYYAAIEQIKSGLLMDLRYKTRIMMIEPPSVWIFSNELPDKTLLSADRWKIWTINDNYEFVAYNEPHPIGSLEEYIEATASTRNQDNIKTDDGQIIDT